MASSLAQRIREGIDTPAKKRSYNQVNFTRAAARYDWATAAMSLGRDGAWKRALVAALPAWSAPRCVDLACGTGDVALRLAARYPAATVVGVDLTPSMLTVAGRRSRNGSARLRLVGGDLARLPLADGWADIVTGSYALRNAPALDDALGEIRRVLRTGGVAAFLDFSKPVDPRGQRAALVVLRYWCGLWGLLLHGKADTHAYISESLRQFPDREALRRRLAGHGFRVVDDRHFYGGLLELLVVRKVAAEPDRGAAVRSASTVPTNRPG